MPVSPLNSGIAGIDPATPTPTPADLARAYLRLADAAPRCSHVRDNGRRCGCPALRGEALCYHHARIQAESRAVAALPSVDDPSSLHAALQRVLSDLFAGRLRARTAGQLLYGLHIAVLNLRHSGAWK